MGAHTGEAYLCCAAPAFGVKGGGSIQGLKLSL